MASPLTPSPEPVSRYTGATSTTVLTVSPHREIAWAANKRRYPARASTDCSPGLASSCHESIVGQAEPRSRTLSWEQIG